TAVGLITDQRGPGFARIANGTVDIGAYEVTPFFDTFTGTGSLSSNWQNPLPLAEKYLFIYRRLRDGFTENNKAISSAIGVNIEQVVGLSSLSPTLQADVGASNALTTSVGLVARLHSNGDYYAAILTNTNVAKIVLYRAATNTFTALQSQPVSSN